MGKRSTPSSKLEGILGDGITEKNNLWAHRGVGSEKCVAGECRNLKRKTKRRFSSVYLSPSTFVEELIDK